jgi:hypothetical protein
MAHQFNRHYTLAEARALLPLIRDWLGRLVELRDALARHDEQLKQLLAGGQDIGGRPVQEWLVALAAIKEILGEFRRREIQIKNLDRGLVDFPAFHEGREVFFCWEQGEEEIEFWHDLDDGYAGRERL